MDTDKSGKSGKVWVRHLDGRRYRTFNPEGEIPVAGSNPAGPIL